MKEFQQTEPPPLTLARARPCAQAGDVNARCGTGGGGCGGAVVMETGDHNLDVKTRRNRETDRKTDGRMDGRTGG